MPGPSMLVVKTCNSCPFAASAAEAMDGKDWSPIAHGWQIARDHMEDAHAPPLTVSTSTIHRLDQKAESEPQSSG